MSARRRLVATVVVAALASPAAAGAARTPKPSYRLYRVTGLSGSERVDFAGDAGAGCAAHGVCGISGTETYTPDPPGASSIAFVLELAGQKAGAVELGTGTTTATVTTAGADAPCTDTLEVGAATAVLGIGPAGWFGELHGDLPGGQGSDDGVFATHCAGPRVRDLATAKALPRTSFRRSALDRPALTLDLVSHKPFSGSGFAGTVTADIRVRLRRLRVPKGLGTTLTGVQPAPLRH